MAGNGSFLLDVFWATLALVEEEPVKTQWRVNMHQEIEALFVSSLVATLPFDACASCVGRETGS